MTTGGPLPIATFGIFGMGVVALGVGWPPDLPKSQITVKNPNMPTTTNRSLSLRNKFLSAGGIGRELLVRAAYGGGRDVFRGGIAKCIWEVVEV